MINSKGKSEILALIPARSGSKRIPKKNISFLKGKPLISYTIEAAKGSAYISRIIVSTDSEEIASIARQYGAETPFLRPLEISEDDSTELQFFEHVLDWLRAHENYEPKLIVLLYPTAPFRNTESIDRAIENIMKHPEADSLRSVKLCSEHPYKMWIIEEEYLSPFIKCEDPNMHTFSYQRLPTIYVQNANIYITKPETIRFKKSPTGEVIVPFVMNEIESVDINTAIDLKIAETIIIANEEFGI